MATTLQPGQTFLIHLRPAEDGTSITIPSGTIIRWSSNDPTCASITALAGDFDAIVTALAKGSATIKCELIQGETPQVVLRETVRVEQPDLYKLVVDPPTP